MFIVVEIFLFLYFVLYFFLHFWKGSVFGKELGSLVLLLRVLFQ